LHFFAQLDELGEIATAQLWPIAGIPQDEAVLFGGVRRHGHAIDAPIPRPRGSEPCVQLLPGIIFAPVGMIEQSLIIANDMIRTDKGEALGRRQ
jgi:hypothetical protein